MKRRARSKDSKKGNSEFKAEGKKKKKAFQDSPKQLQKMHMAQVLMTKLLVDMLIANKFFTDSP